MKYIIPFAVPFIVVMCIIPLLMKISHKYGFTDKPTKRKQHRGPIPLCGGVGMFIGFFSFYFFISGEPFSKQIWIFLGAFFILLIGLVDDYYKSVKKEFPIYPRLIVQLLSATLVFNSGIVFKGFTNPFSGEYILLTPVLQFLLTVTWIFGVTTVINWSDGMDGLAGGITLISSLTFFFAGLILGRVSSALSALVLAGAILAFLYYNRYPAKIFMGDSGANFLGFMLSIIALDGLFKGTTLMSVVIPILALAVPIFDNLFVIIKRYVEGKPVYQADRSQIHFRLQEKGLNNKQVVNTIMLISLISSTVSLVLLLIKK